jgi:hypothetical protein
MQQEEAHMPYDNEDDGLCEHNLPYEICFQCKEKEFLKWFFALIFAIVLATLIIKATQ